MAQAVAQARSRKERPHTLRGAVEAIDEDPFDPVRRLLLGRHALKLNIGLRKGGGTGVLGISQVPNRPATDNRRQVHFVGETVTMLLVCQEVGGQWQPTPRQHRHQTPGAERTDQAIEGHGGDMANHRTQL